MKILSSPTTRTGASVIHRHGSFFVFFLFKFGTYRKTLYLCTEKTENEYYGTVGKQK